MSISRTELSSAVIGKLELNASDAALLAKFQVYENLSEAQLELMNVLPIQYLSEGIKTVLFPLELNESEYQWPTVDFPFLRYVSLWVDYDNPIVMGGVAPASINPGKRCLEYDASIHHTTPDQIATQNYPFIDLNVEVGFMLYPVPDINVTDGARLRYIYKPTDITSSQDSLLNPGLKNLVIFKATALSALVDQYRPDLATKYENMYDKLLSRYLPKEEKRK
jgi:hypothetical protein